MKAICPKCNTAFEVKTLASLGGKARWQGVSVAERSKIAGKPSRLDGQSTNKPRRKSHERHTTPTTPDYGEPLRAFWEMLFAIETDN